MFAGYASRILKEIRNTYIEKGLKNTENKNIKINININDSPRRKYSVFILVLSSNTSCVNLYNSTKL